MKILKYVLIFVLIVVVGLLIYTFIQPSEYEFSRTRVIDAPAELVYANVDDYKKWEAWGPWHEDDPSIVATYNEKSKGPGVSYSWTSANGDGKATRVEAVPHESLSDDLNFGSMGTSTAFWKFKPVDGGTEVTWGMRAENTPFMMKFFSAISGGYDAMMGPMYERGLERLDSVTQVQAKEYAEMNAWSLGDISRKPMESLKFIGYRHAVEIDMEIVTKIYEEFMPKAGIYAAESGLEEGDYIPGAITYKWDFETGEADFSVGLFLMKDLAPAEGMEAVQTPKGDVLMLSKFGNYGTGEEEAHTALEAYMAENSLELNGAHFEMYVNDPTAVKPSEIQTDIFYPIKK